MYSDIPMNCMLNINYYTLCQVVKWNRAIPLNVTSGPVSDNVLQRKLKCFVSIPTITSYQELNITY